MECKFTVDQRVACIAALDQWRVHTGQQPKQFPLRGNVYRITELEPDEDGITYLGLEGFPDASFDYRAFRPLQDRPKEADTDISVFYPALNTKSLEPVP